MTAQTLSSQDVKDLISGSAILGSGGGGQLEEGEAYIQLAMNAPFFPPKLLPLSALNSTDIIAAPYLLGGICNPDISSSSSLPGIAVALDMLDVKPAGFIPIEIGISNMAVAIYLSSLTNIPIIDADPTGRSVPECIHSTFAINQLPIGITVAVSEQGEQFLIKGVENDQRSETLLRTLCTVCENTLSVIDHVLPKSIIADALIQGTVTKAWTLGMTWRQSYEQMKKEGKEKGGQCHEIIAKKGKGCVLFKGYVTDVTTKEQDGFTIGDIFIKDDNENDEKCYKISYKNENMYVQEQVTQTIVATIPEIIVVFDVHNGNVLLNPDVKVNTHVAVVVLPAPEPFLTEKGLELFGPKYVELTHQFKSAITSS